MLNNLIALVAPIRVRKLPSRGEQEHCNSDLLQQPACEFEFFILSTKQRENISNWQYKTVARENKF